MSKYQIGDKFIVEITNIDSKGMGTVIYLDDSIPVTEKQLDVLEQYSSVPLSSNSKSQKPKNDTHTLEELRERIMRLNIILGECVKKYKDLKAQTSEVCQILDAEIEE